MSFETKDVASTGSALSAGFVCRAGGQGGATMLRSDAYPPSPLGAALRQARQALGLSTREASMRLRIPMATISALETGRKVFLAEEDWARAAALLAPPLPPGCSCNPALQIGQRCGVNGPLVCDGATRAWCTAQGRGPRVDVF